MDARIIDTNESHAIYGLHTQYIDHLFITNYLSPKTAMPGCLHNNEQSDTDIY